LQNDAKLSAGNR